MLGVADAPPPPLWTYDWWALLLRRGGTFLAIALVITFVGRWYRRRARRLAKDAADDQVEGRSLRRRATIVGVVSGVVEVIAWFVAITVVLDVFKVPLGPLFASAGVIGVALGFGAQAIVRDTLAGFFLAMEGQFDVGDIVDLQTDGGLVSGTIEGLTLRVTSVRQFDGTLSIVPNGTILVTSNKTRGWGRAIVDLRVALDEDSEKVRSVLEELIDQLAEQEPLKGWLRERPKVLGVTQLTDVAQVIRVVADTSPNHRADTERELRGRIAQRMAERGIRVPPIAAPRPT
ncbi:MAG: mechanosensitive ion channel family protein [Planctomycetaceae bacterium]